MKFFFKNSISCKASFKIIKKKEIKTDEFMKNELQYALPICKPQGFYITNTLLRKKW